MLAVSGANYLRLSITDRCNLRCSYCMPEEGVELGSHDEVLRYDELLSIARAAVSLGVRKIRITGGEPLVRKGVIAFLSDLSGIEGLQELVLTTNGTLLERYCTDLRAVGVARVNVSLDTLRADRFEAITRRSGHGSVLRGIEAARRAGLEVKVNMVVIRGVNEDEVVDMARWALDRGITVRFIEQMPTRVITGGSQGFVGGEEILDLIESRYKLTPYEKSSLGGPAREFSVEGSRGRVGIIPAVTDCFCQMCNRLRVTAAGGLRTCLFTQEEVSLKPILRGGSKVELVAALSAAIEDKKVISAFGKAPLAPLAMSAVGG